MSRTWEEEQAAQAANGRWVEGSRPTGFQSKECCPGPSASQGAVISQSEAPVLPGSGSLPAAPGGPGTASRGGDHVLLWPSKPDQAWSPAGPVPTGWRCPTWGRPLPTTPMAMKMGISWIVYTIVCAEGVRADLL